MIAKPIEIRITNLSVLDMFAKRQTTRRDSCFMFIMIVFTPLTHSVCHPNASTLLLIFPPSPIPDTLLLTVCRFRNGPGYDEK
ncbi:MAG: hypothetical protein ABR968_14280 [Bacteroidales bacterium]